jgi:hypothetical protein
MISAQGSLEWKTFARSCWEERKLVEHLRETNLFDGELSEL